MTMSELVRGQKNYRLWELIDNTYGSPEELAKILDLGIEMLFYIEEDVFERKDVQNVVSALRGIVLNLRQ